ncbi:ankyrin repeat-containing domain protein [Paramyrothecium foliicola]|nr:ankyrin repeat-containing domain protein [Paramyrothecium foliicola]
MTAELASSKLESLFDDIFYCLIHYLDMGDLAQLVVTSKTLANRLQPFLYGTPEARQKSLGWACINGHATIARHAVLCGAQVGVVSSQSSPVLTLYLAAKHNRPKLFNVLVELGARMDETVVEHLGLQVKRIMYWLCRRRELHGCLGVVLDKRLDEQVKRLHCATIAWPLIPAIDGSVPISIIEKLCERGANPNQRRCYHDRDQTPLSAAILNGNVEAIELLIDKGALIPGNKRSTLSKSPIYIPVFAAAKAMAISGTKRAVVTACLAHGADLNDRAVQRCNPRYYEDDQDMVYRISQKALYYPTSPLLTYLDNIPSWPSTAVDARLDDIDFFLSHGARVSIDDCKPLLPKPAHYVDVLPSPSCVEFLLSKWGVRRLAEQGFTTILIHLAQQGGAPLTHKKLFIQNEWYDNQHSDNRHSHGIVTAWRCLVSAAVEHDLASTPGRTTDALDQLLADLIAEKARKECFRKDAPRLDDLCLATLEVLLQFGANINAPVLSRGKTPLYDVCEYFSILSTNPDQWSGRALVSSSIVDRRLHLVKFLREKGADPQAKVGDTSATGLLAEGLDRASEWGRPFVLDVKKLLEDRF